MLKRLHRGWQRIREIKHLPRTLSIVAGTLVTLAAGIACLHYRFGEPLIRWSYDVPFLWRSPLDTREITLVYLDEYSAKQLNQPLTTVWDRGLHAPLLDRLTQDGARLVFYDIVFDAPSEDPAADAAFADAIKRNGKVVLGAALDIVERLGAGAQVSQERISAPIPPLRRAAAGWGLLAFRPVDPDYGVRQIYTGNDRIPASTWKSAELLGAPATKEPRLSPVQRWVNYYGPRDPCASVNSAQALDPGGVPAGFFKDRIVMIGGRSVIGALQVGRDEFATPYKEQFTPGVEVHATILLNLLRGEWLTRWQPRWEMIAIIVAGLMAGALSFLRPGIPVIAAAAFVSFAIACAALWSAWNQRLWWPWLIPAAVQMPVGLVWSVGSQYLLESRRRKELRKAFGFYLSPEMADRIADSDFDLRPGGKIVEVSVIFTDLENFTTLSEKLDPTEVSEILTTYFGQTTKWILNNRGTIIKYIGDAVFAAWGAPIDEPEHALPRENETGACKAEKVDDRPDHKRQPRCKATVPAVMVSNDTRPKPAVRIMSAKAWGLGKRRIDSTR